MNKLKTDISSRLSRPASSSSSSSSSSTTKTTALGGVKINAPMLVKAAPNTQSMLKLKETTSVLAQQQLKKKRTALENISNASTVNQQTLVNASTCAAGPVPAVKEVSKKSRFGMNAPLPPAPPPPPPVPSVKKADSLTYGKKPVVSKELNSDSKENLVMVTGIKKTTTMTTTRSHSVVNATNVKIEKYEEVKQECMSTEVQIERQLASTNLTASVESSSSSDVGMSEASTAAAAVPLRAETVEGWEDIDAADAGDEFNAGDYVAHIFKYYREREAQFAVGDYIKSQPHISKHMRLLLVDWMVEVQQQLEFNHEVLYLSVKLLDLYLHSRRIEKERLQLLGGAAMFIACKFEERMPPIIDDFIFVSDSAYDRKELIKMEIEILKTVRFDIGLPLSYTFLRRYSKCLRADMRFLTLARYVLELSLQEYAFASARESLKACAALYLALQMSVRYERHARAQHQKLSDAEVARGRPALADAPALIVSTAVLTATEWNATLIHYTGAFVKDFIDYVPLMNKLMQTAAQSKYKTIFKKYSHPVFYEVAKIPPLPDAEVDTLVRGCSEQ